MEAPGGGAAVDELDRGIFTNTAVNAAGRNVVPTNHVAVEMQSGHIVTPSSQTFGRCFRFLGVRSDSKNLTIFRFPD
jgi:hypothetical protein